MAVRLRLMRMGRKGQPFYRIVAVDSRKRRDGAYLERIGHYNPLRRPAEVEIDEDKALKWLGQGAIPSDTVRNLFSRRGVMLAFDMQKRGLKDDEIRENMVRFRMQMDEKLSSAEEKAIAAQSKKLMKHTPAEAEETVVEEKAEEVVADVAQEDNSQKAAAPETAETPEPEVEVKPSEATDKENTKKESAVKEDKASSKEKKPSEGEG